ncbi:hypothetical protein [Rhizobium sp. BR 314]|uniref:hypothetical protein n=1 Tax=Rhizobium sp. BR 314 TaxID=3040013 RepID=UPI0039BFDCA6
MSARHFGTMALAGACLLAVPAFAQEEGRSPIVRQAFKLAPTDGCFHYEGNAVEFIGRFRAGSYVSVTMHTLDEVGQPLPASDEQRVPVMDAPEFRVSGPALWFGPLPASRPYTISFMPTAAFGYSGRVTICGRGFPPS